MVDDIEAKFKAIIAEKLGVEEYEITPEAQFAYDLGADSLDIVELVMEFESEFDVTIPDEDAERLVTVGDAMNYMHLRIASERPARSEPLPLEKERTSEKPKRVSEDAKSQAHNVFVSYRREDSEYVTGRICDRLTEHFGKEQIFTDVDSIPLGLDFRAYLDE